jgi:predicted MPP superfamily phosphohydrolase
MIYYIIAAIVLIVIVLHLLSAIRLRNAYEIVNFAYSNPKIPEAFNGYKIALISDLHLRHNKPDARIRSIIEDINKQKPDLLLVGGDLGPDMQRCVHLLAQIDVNNAYAVYGNHDYHKNRLSLPEAVKDTGITLLKNNGVRLGHGFFLAGTDDIKAGRPDVAKAVSGAGQEDFVLLLAHNPDIIEEIGEEHVDFMLSGHTHGGQLSFFGLFAPVNSSKYGNKYRTGFMQYKGKPDLIVTNGVGTSLVNIRTFSMPQAHIITLKSSIKS